jgi:hypothetical protein
MRPVRVTVNSAAVSPWVPVDYISAWFGIGLGVILSEDGALTYSVDFTFDNPQVFSQPIDPFGSVSISRSGTVATVTDTGQNGLGHGLTTGDSVVLKGTGSAVLDSPVTTQANAAGDFGWTVASTPSPITWTYTVANSGPTTAIAQVARMRVFPHATLTALTARANGSLNYPVQAVRLRVSAYTAGFADLTVLQGNAR